MSPRAVWMAPESPDWKALASAADLSSSDLAFSVKSSQFDQMSGLPRFLPTASISARLASTSKAAGMRSEEHTSELQSLMRISYAVFCLTKKKKPKAHTQYYTHNK